MATDNHDPVEAGETEGPASPGKRVDFEEGVAANGDNPSTSRSERSFSKELDAAISEVLPTPEMVDTPDFNAIDFINKIFPTEQSLSNIDSFVSRMKVKIRNLDEEILDAVRQQSTAGKKAKSDLEEAKKAIVELFSKVSDIKSKAMQSEIMVQDICRDIKSLDYAKKHLTTTITALKRLNMLTNAVDQMENMATRRQYKEAANLLGAVNQLSTHFDAYKDIPKISELRSRIDAIKRDLHRQIMQDFNGLASSGPDSYPTYASACLVVDALSEDVKKELIAWFCDSQLSQYNMLFQPGSDAASLEKCERRYGWLRRQLRTYEEQYVHVFPVEWRVPQHLSLKFCEMTHSHLGTVMDQTRDRIDVAVLLHMLQKTKEFEHEIEQRYTEQGSSEEEEEEEDDESDGDEPAEGSAAAIRKKYQREKDRERRDSLREEKEKKKAESGAVKAERFVYSGTVSSVFEGFMGVYLSTEDKTLSETLERLVREESWATPSEDANLQKTKVLLSSSELFVHIKKSMQRCSKLTRGTIFFELSKVFKKYLKRYADVLNTKMPKNNAATITGADVHSMKDWQLKLSESEEELVCFIVNTAEYCHETTMQLGDSLRKIVAPEFAEKIDLGLEQDEFYSIITRGVKVLVLCTETRLEPSLVKMAKIPWATLEEVGDQSDYVTEVLQTLKTTGPRLSGALSPLYFKFFCDKFVASFIPRYEGNIFKCRRVNNMGVQQLLLDCQALRQVLSDFPGYGNINAPITYTNYVGREMSKAEAIMKVLLSTSDNLLETYKRLIPEGSAQEFQKLMDLKGLKKTDQDGLTEAFNQSSISQGAKNLRKLFMFS